MWTKKEKIYLSFMWTLILVGGIYLIVRCYEISKAESWEALQSEVSK
jgi:hypothetical protein